jgi:hypothetical protein
MADDRLGRPSTDEGEYKAHHDLCTLSVCGFAETAPLLRDPEDEEGGAPQDPPPSFAERITAVIQEPLSPLTQVLLVVALILLLLSSVFIGLFAGVQHKLNLERHNHGGDGGGELPNGTVTVTSTLTSTSTTTHTTTSVPFPIPVPIPIPTSKPGDPSPPIPPSPPSPPTEVRSLVCSTSIDRWC